MFDGWHFYDHFTIDEASMVAAQGQPDDLEYVHSYGYKYLGNGFEPYDKATFSRFIGARTIFFREAKAHLDLHRETELSFEVIDTNFSYNDDDYYQYVIITRASLERWLSKRQPPSTITQDISLESKRTTDHESLCRRILELESQLKECNAELDELRIGRKLKQREQTVIDLIAALKNIILESTDLKGCDQTLSQNELVQYLSSEYTGAGTSERTYNELFSQINNLSRVKKDNKNI